MKRNVTLQSSNAAHFLKFLYALKCAYLIYIRNDFFKKNKTIIFMTTQNLLCLKTDTEEKYTKDKQQTE